MVLCLGLIAAFIFFCCPETTHSAAGSNAFLIALGLEDDGKILAKAFASASVGF